MQRLLRDRFLSAYEGCVGIDKLLSACLSLAQNGADSAEDADYPFKIFDNHHPISLI